MFRWRVLGGLTAVLLGLGSPAALSAGAGSRGTKGSLEIYYTSPVLAHAGERVLMPVQVVCVDANGHACRASVTLSTRVGIAPWRATAAPATPGLSFDLSAAAARAVGAGADGSVRFVIRARDESGREVTLPPTGEPEPLSFFVATRITVRRIPTIPFGGTRAGSVALSLPWGSGPMRAGLVPGRESASLGPSSFDVDRHGRIYLLDPEQGRMAVFSHGRLTREAVLPLGADAQIAAGPQGAARVIDRSTGALVARRVDASGAASDPDPLTGAMVDAVRTVGGQWFGLVLPLDAWVALDGTSEPSAGLPLPGGGAILTVARPSGLRLATSTRDGRIEDAVELRATARIGEVALAESDGRAGVWIVVHLWGESPAADQYQVMHLLGTRVLGSFAVADLAFADTPPLSRFRMGADGALYQLTSTAAGIQIIRFDLKEER